MKFTLIVLQALLAIGALYGGGAMIISPAGELLGLPLSMLESSPFNDFLIPGIILFVVLGIVPCLTVYGLLSKQNMKYAEMINLFSDMHWAWSFSIYVSIALIIWIQIQILFVDGVHWAHTLYIFWGILMIVIALLPGIRSQYNLKSI